MRSMKWQILGVLALACSVMPALHAQVISAPEIDANSLVSGLALAGAAVAMYRARRAK
jgi:hypothetical protein